MVKSSVITVMLSLMVVMGIVPIVAGIVLLVAKKIKGSAFWIGVLMTVVSSIILTVVQLILLGGGTAVAAVEASADKAFTVTIQLIAAVFDIALVLLSFKAFVKRSRDLKGAVSFGIGFGIVNFITYGISMFSNYMTALMINTGTFEQTYKPMIEMGTVDEETVRMLKRAVVELKASELLMYLPNCIGVTLMMTAVSILIVRGINKGSLLPNLLIALGAHAAAAVIAGLITNIYIAVSLFLVVSIAVFIYAFAVRGDLKMPEASPVEDSFLKSVREVKEEAASGEEYNPYE